MALHRTVAINVFLALGVALTAAAGEMHGMVRLDGDPPALPAPTVPTASPDHPLEGCGELPKPSQRLLMDAHGGIRNAVAWVEMPDAPQKPAAGDAQVLNQRACVFEPHVLLLPAGGTLTIRNSDPMLHNVRIFRERTMLMHEWQQPQAADLTWRFEEPGRYMVRCGVHAWMYAWVVVAGHRYYALTDQAGAFTIPDLPAGDYTLHVWHETLGELTQRVHVQAERSVVMVQFSGGTAIQ